MTRRVVLVCGPPCAGKSTYVEQNASPGDAVVDFDRIAMEMGSRSQWDHSPVVRGRAVHEQQRRERQVAGMQSGTAWVIRTAARGSQRRSLARLLRADEVVLLDPGRHVVQARARTERPPGTLAAIADWYADFTP